MARSCGQELLAGLPKALTQQCLVSACFVGRLAFAANLPTPYQHLCLYTVCTLGTDLAGEFVGLTMSCFVFLLSPRIDLASKYELKIHGHILPVLREQLGHVVMHYSVIPASSHRRLTACTGQQSIPDHISHVIQRHPCIAIQRKALRVKSASHRNCRRRGGHTSKTYAAASPLSTIFF